MKIGFTGTQIGMTPSQKRVVSQLLKSGSPTEAHMGDCIGADEDFYHLVKELAPNAKTIGHVPNIDSKRAKLEYDEEFPPKPYLERNHDIVDNSDVMVATPKETEEQLRSGTWATVRYAKKKNKKLVVVFPSGAYSIYNNK
jgi:hypothetical protein